jgi:5-methylcytosine-specific restriction endonuclease McrA
VTIKKDARGRKRDYKQEYDRDHSGKKAKKHRAARNQARAEAMADGRVRKGDGKEVDHKKPLSKGGSNAKSNRRVVSRRTNRKKGAK